MDYDPLSHRDVYWWLWRNSCLEQDCLSSGDSHPEASLRRGPGTKPLYHEILSSLSNRPMLPTPLYLVEGWQLGLWWRIIKWTAGIQNVVRAWLGIPSLQIGSMVYPKSLLYDCKSQSKHLSSTSSATLSFP